MSALDDLIQEIADEDLRRRIEKEIATLKGTKKFGLVFEPQNPECTPLYDVPVKKKSLVALKAGKLDELYRLTKIVDDKISCVRVSDGEEMTFNKDDLISVAQFGDAIYPYLQPLDTVCNAPDSSLWHALIEADNYHIFTSARLIAFTLTRLITPEHAIGSTTTIMSTRAMSIVTASGLQ